MPHLVVLALLALLVAVGVAIQRMILGASRGRSDQTYRPHSRGWKTPDEAAGATVLMRRDQLVGVRDAFTAAPIDPRADLLRCATCQSLYHATSVQSLRRDNRGRCVGCDGRLFEPVQLVD